MAPALTVEEEQRFLYYFYQAQLLFEEEKYQTSFELMQFCYKLNPNDAIVCQYLGDFYVGLKRYDVALTFFEQAQKHNPKNVHIWYRLKECYLTLRLPDKALYAQDQIDKIDGYDAYSALTRYRIYALKGDANNALKAINDYLKIEPENIQFLLFRVQLYEILPKTKIKTKIAAYEQLLAVDPYNLSVLNNYAYLLATNKGDLRKAEALSRKTIQAEPNNPVYLDTYAWILFLRGEQSLAEFYISKALREVDQQNEAEVRSHYEQIMKQHK